VKFDVVSMKSYSSRHKNYENTQLSFRVGRFDPGLRLGGLFAPDAAVPVSDPRQRKKTSSRKLDPKPHDRRQTRRHRSSFRLGERIGVRFDDDHGYAVYRH